MKNIAKFLCLVLTLSCNTAKKATTENITPVEYITIDGQTFEAFAGPNLIRISPNFYADQTEATNTAYKEFMHWTKVTYGMESQEYVDILPDVNVWNFQNHTESLVENYFWEAEFDDYPVVGITLEQAKMYSNWRTERVAEMLLIEKGILNPNMNANKDNCFTIERFNNGIYPLRKELKTKFIYPRFTVPTMKEWNALSGISSEFKFGIDSLDAHNQRFLKRDNALFHTLEDLDNDVDKKMFKSRHQNSIKSCPIRPAQYSSENVFGLYHTIGNVAEMVDNVGIAKGGDWNHSLEHAILDKNIKQNIPNCWTGFRCVARLVVMN